MDYKTKKNNYFCIEKREIQRIFLLNLSYMLKQMIKLFFQILWLEKNESVVVGRDVRDMTVQLKLSKNVRLYFI